MRVEALGVLIPPRSKKSSRRSQRVSSLCPSLSLFECDEGGKRADGNNVIHIAGKKTFNTIFGKVKAKLADLNGPPGSGAGTGSTGYILFTRCIYSSPSSLTTEYFLDTNTSHQTRISHNLHGTKIKIKTKTRIRTRTDLDTRHHHSLSLGLATSRRIRFLVGVTRVGIVSLLLNVRPHLLHFAHNVRVFRSELTRTTEKLYNSY